MRRFMLLTVSIVAVIFAAVVAVVAFTGHAHQAPRTDPVKAARTAASEACHAAVLKQLKAPATARWSGETVVVGGNDPRVQGYVDAENEFGALVRLTYSCRPNAATGKGISAIVEQSG